MNGFLAFTAALFAALALYIAAQSARHSGDPEGHLDAGRNLPGWTYIFAGSGVLLASLGPYDHLRLLAGYGFQANHLALSLILVALTAALFQKRVWLAAQITGGRTVGEVMGAHYQSPSIRLYLLVVLFLFAVPSAAYFLSLAGELLAEASTGEVSRAAATSATAVLLFLSAAIGGWRATVYIVAILSALTIVLMIFAAGFAALVFDGLAVTKKSFTVHEGILADALPGVIQFARGIGRDVPRGGLWTTAAVLSFALAMAGAALSPSFSFLGLTVKSRSGLAISQVWLTAGLAAGVLILLGPLIAGEQGPGDGLISIAMNFAAHDELAAVCLIATLLSGLLIPVAFFTASGANVATIELVDRYVLPGLSQPDRRVAARITLAVIYAAVAILAVFFPVAAAALSTLALPLSVQLFPAYLGLCWVPWMSRSAVLVGLIIGSLFVLFTEPPGLMMFDAAFLELPWGRWPLTIHSAAWGLAVNIPATLIVAIFTRRDAEREQRNALHAIFFRDHRMNFGARAARSAKWSLALLWVFFALGPGAILGNSFFAQPVFSGAKIALGMPSLWVWQAVFWILGVMIVWWLAYFTRLSIVETARLRVGELQEMRYAAGASPRPAWIALLLTRLAARQNRTKQGERRFK